MKDENLEMGEGYLLVKVSTGFGVIPIEGATVTLFNNDEEKNDIIYVLLTDHSGLTERIPLPAPNKDLSMSPDNVKPYSTYSIVVSADGFYTKENADINVFDTITAMINMDLTPLHENDIYDSEY